MALSSSEGLRSEQVAVDEKQIEVDGETRWLYAAIDTESKLLLEVDVYSRHGTKFDRPAPHSRYSTPRLLCPQMGRHIARTLLNLLQLYPIEHNTATPSTHSSIPSYD
jgi:hypothetical protein